jgi:sugar/nucleoside kinase (ribokinase family)
MCSWTANTLRTDTPAIDASHHGLSLMSGTEPMNPPSEVAFAALELAREASPPFLLDHSLRTYAWAVELARIDGLTYDAELLFVAAILHDLGLTDRFNGPRCFENEGALAAAEFTTAHGWTGERSERLAAAIRFHMQPRVVVEDGAEAYLLSEATGCDVRGHRIDELPEEVVDEMVARYPRLGFGPAFVELLETEARAKPGCLAGLYLEGGLAERILSAPFDR